MSTNNTRPQQQDVAATDQQVPFDEIEFFALVEAMPNKNHVITNNDTPLTFAASINKPNVVEKLIQKYYVLVNQQRSSDGNTALFIAVQNNAAAVARILLKHGASMDIPNHAQMTPLFAAQKNADMFFVLTQMFDLNMLHACASLNAVNTFFCWRRECEIAYASNYFVHIASELNLENPTRPLSVAIQKGHTQIAKEFLLHGASATLATSKNEPNGIYEACKLGNLEMVQLLIHGMLLTKIIHTICTDSYLCKRKTTIPSITDSEILSKIVNEPVKSSTLLFAALEEGHDHIVNYLLDLGADINAKV